MPNAVSGLPETAFGTHDFSRSVSGAQGVAGHPRVQRRSSQTGNPVLPKSRRRVLLAVVSNALSQEEESAFGRGRPWGILIKTGSGRLANRPVDWTQCYTVRRLCISTLHVSLIIRVLPRAESATGCIFASSIREPAPFMSKAGISEAVAMAA